jgi:hypothetical protein
MLGAARHQQLLLAEKLSKNGFSAIYTSVKNQQAEKLATTFAEPCFDGTSDPQ